MFHYHNSFIQRSLSQNVLWTNDRVLENTSLIISFNSEHKTRSRILLFVWHNMDSLITFNIEREARSNYLLCTTWIHLYLLIKNIKLVFACLLFVFACITPEYIEI